MSLKCKFCADQGNDKRVGKKGCLRNKRGRKKQERITADILRRSCCGPWVQMVLCGCHFTQRKQMDSLLPSPHLSYELWLTKES